MADYNEYYREPDFQEDYRRQDWEYEQRQEDYRREDNEYEQRQEDDRRQEEKSRELMRGSQPDSALIDARYGTNAEQTSATASEVAEFEVQTLSFYESGPHRTEASQRQYASRFPKSETRYVQFEVVMRNRLFGVQEHKHQLVAGYYKPDDTLMGQVEGDIVVKPEWQTFQYNNGLGWEEAGNWPPGTYRMEIWRELDLIAEGQFSIYEDRAEKPFEYQTLRFYESGPSRPEVSQRQYETRFAKSETRYVFFQVNMRNLLWGVVEHEHKQVSRYYKPDGSLMGQMEGDIIVKPEWETFSFTYAWGWDEAGNWPPETYRVEIFIDGEKITEGHFDIFGDSFGEMLEAIRGSTTD